MVDVVYLVKGENPPEDADWALVAQDTKGRYSGMGSVAHSKGVTFYTPYPASEADLDTAIARAKAWADSRGVPFVYVVAK